MVADVPDVPTVPGVTGTQSGGSSGGSSGSSSRSGSAASRARAGSGSNGTHTRFDRLPRRFERLLEQLLAGRHVDENLRRLEQLLASASPRLRARILRLVRREIRALEQGRTTPEERRRIKRLHRVEDLFAPPAGATVTTAATPVSAAGAGRHIGLADGRAPPPRRGSRGRGKARSPPPPPIRGTGSSGCRPRSTASCSGRSCSSWPRCSSRSPSRSPRCHPRDTRGRSAARPALRVRLRGPGPRRARRGDARAARRRRQLIASRAPTIVVPHAHDPAAHRAAGDGRERYISWTTAAVLRDRRSPRRDAERSGPGKVAPP